MNYLQVGILKTLAYSAVFNFPLLEKEVFKYWIGKLPVGSKVISQELRRLTIQKKVIKEGNYFSLRGVTSVKRQKTAEIYLKKCQVVRQKIKMLTFSPTVKMIAVTGSLAAENAPRESDIDLLVVSRCGWLWLTRLLTILILELQASRRRPNDINVCDKLCLNMYLDETNLATGKKNRTLYIAREIVQMKPIFNRDNTYEKFINQNLWIKKFFPNAMEYNRFGSYPKNAGEDQQNILEKIAYFLQLAIMKKKMTREVVGPKEIRFHPNDCSGKIMADYFSLLKKYGIEE